MAKLGINTGSIPNDGTGDSLLSGAIKINNNFTEIYNAIGNGTTITNSIAFANTAGFSTVSGFSTTSGSSSYSAVSGLSTFATQSGTSDSANYANLSGLSTVAEFAQNLTGTPNINVGVLTASLYSGNGSNLTGVITSIVAGSNVTISQSNGQVTVNSSGGGGSVISSQWGTIASGIITSSNVGIGTTIVSSALQVNNGTISLTGTPGSNIAISLKDNHRITFGDSQLSDSSIFYDGNNLNLRASGSVNISDSTGRLVLSAVTGEGPILYYDNDKKFQILQTGAYVVGDLGVLGIVTATNLVVSGVITATNGANIDGLQIAQDSLTGTGNIRIGDSNTLGSTTGGNYNIAIGQEALDNIRNGDNNIAIGYQVGKVLNASDSNYGSNVLIGYQSFLNVDGSSDNVAVGYRSLYGSTNFGNWDAIQMTALGGLSGYNLQNSRFSSFFGYQSGYNQTSADYNTFLGYKSGYDITTGDSNVILGSYTGNQNGLDIRTSSNNVVISDGDGNIRLYANSSGNIGIKTTNPLTPLQVENVYGVDAGSGTFSPTAGIPYVANSWTISNTDFKTAEYTLWFQYTTGFQSQKVLIANDGTSAYYQEYAIMTNNSSIVSIGATVESGQVKLLWTPEPGVNSGLVTFRYTRETMI